MLSERWRAEVTKFGGALIIEGFETYWKIDRNVVLFSVIEVGLPMYKGIAMV